MTPSLPSPPPRDITLLLLTYCNKKTLMNIRFVNQDFYSRYIEIINQAHAHIIDLSHAEIKKIHKAFTKHSHIRLMPRIFRAIKEVLEGRRQDRRISDIAKQRQCLYKAIEYAQAELAILLLKSRPISGPCLLNVFRLAQQRHIDMVTRYILQDPDFRELLKPLKGISKLTSEVDVKDMRRVTLSPA